MKLKEKAITSGGHRVINLSYVPFNSAGNKVTFPIKGTVVLSEKPLKTTYHIWTSDGVSIVFGSSEFDLVNFKDE